MTTFYEDLPANSEAAFVFLEAKFKAELESTFENGNSGDFEHKTYLIQTLSAAEALGIVALQGYYNIPVEQIDYWPFQHEITKLTTQLKIHATINKSSLAVGFSQPQKTKLHAFIEKIRLEVESSPASQDKKDTIFNILSTLSKEISKDRSGFDRFADLARNLAGLSKAVEQEGAQPWWKWFKLAMGVVDDAKESEPTLPPPKEIKKLEPPQKRITKLDDDIPF